jgi:hypothetical protein
MSILALSYPATSAGSEPARSQHEEARIENERTFGSGPATQFTGQLNTNNLGGLQLPGKTSHDVNGVGTANTDGGHAESSSVGSVRVGTDEQSTRESVVLKDDLVNDARSGPPETNVVFGARCGQEVVDLLVDVVGASQILCAADLCLDKMVTVDSGWGGHRGHARGHELENGHLGSSILACYAVGAELEVAAATLDLLAVRVVQMRVENLLSKGERAIETLAHNAEVLAETLVVDVVALLPVGHFVQG